jgi:ribosome-associated heat shock protein Hsp15
MATSTEPDRDDLAILWRRDRRGGTGKVALMDSTRVDRWLWSVRLYKTRSGATSACRGGHVRVNGAAAKPSTPVRVGDQVTAHVHDRDRVLKILQVIDKRVGAAIAAQCVADHSPPPEPRDQAVGTFVRDAAAGRPTKKERRQLDRFRDR